MRQRTEKSKIEWKNWKRIEEIKNLTYLESVNRWSHMLHLKGFSPVWTLLRCSANLCASKNPLPHHSQAWGRSLEWRDFWCNKSLSRVIKALPHSPQWKAAIPVCKAMWYLRPRGVLKPRGHCKAKRTIRFRNFLKSILKMYFYKSDGPCALGSRSLWNSRVHFLIILIKSGMKIRILTVWHW